MNSNIFIASCVRTPIGSFNGSLAKITATELGSLVIKEAVAKAGITAGDVEQVFMGQVLQAGSGQAPARQACLKAGLPNKTICTTINKVCASGMKSIVFGTQSIALQDCDVVVAGGMESMSNAPFYLARGETPYGGITLKDSVLFDGLTDSFNDCHMGICAEGIAKRYNISREDQDAFAKQSYKRCAEAISNGTFAKEIISVKIAATKAKPDILVTEDEEVKKVDFSKIEKLNPAFVKPGGTITAANASSLNDGAAACVLASEKAVEKFGMKPLAKIISYADAATDPMDFPIAPALSIVKVLERANLKKDDISSYEINEAFSVVVLANVKELGLDANKININGGAVGLGHPIGMSGARIVNTLAINLKSGEYGLASICNGGGGASSIIIQKL